MLRKEVAHIGVGWLALGEMVLGHGFFSVRPGVVCSVNGLFSPLLMIDAFASAFWYPVSHARILEGG